MRRRERRLSLFVIQSEWRIRPTRIRRNTVPAHEEEETVLTCEPITKEDLPKAHQEEGLLVRRAVMGVEGGLAAGTTQTETHAGANRFGDARHRPSPTLSATVKGQSGR